MTKQFIEEQQKIARETSWYDKYDNLLKLEFETLDTIISRTILATEEEFRKRVEGMKKYEPHIGIGHLHEADMQIAYNQALTDLLSTLTPKE